MSLYDPSGHLIGAPALDEGGQGSQDEPTTVTSVRGHDPNTRGGNASGVVHSSSEESQKPWKKDVLVWSNAILALGVFVGIGFNVYQLTLTREAIDSSNISSRDTVNQLRNQAKAELVAAIAARRAAESANTQADSSRDIAAAAKRQAEISENVQRASENIEAADIEIEKVFCTPATGTLTTDGEVHYSLKNVGSSAAYQVQIAIYFGSYGSVIDASIGKPETQTIVGSGIVVTTESLKIGNGVADFYLKAINARDPRAAKPLHLWGWIRYRDRFSHWHLMVHDAIYIPNSTCGFSPANITAIP